MSIFHTSCFLHIPDCSVVYLSGDIDTDIYKTVVKNQWKNWSSWAKYNFFVPKYIHPFVGWFFLINLIMRESKESHLGGKLSRSQHNEL